MKIDSRLLEKYWSGQCTSEERQAVEFWMNDGIPDKEFSLKTDKRSAEEMKSVLWQNIRQASKIDSVPLEGGDRAVVSLWPKFAIATAVFCVISTVVLLIFPEKHPKLTPDVVSFSQVIVPFGSKQKIVLSDGTMVILNSGSKLSYPKRFQSNNRVVFLDGEAFFQVSKDPKRPFIVQTEKTSTRVLGTRFNLVARKGKANVLTVTEGSVRFTASDSRDTLILYPNMQSIYLDGRMDLHKVKSDQFNAWTKGELIFNSITLHEVVPELERWYNVKIKCKDPELLNYRVRGKFKDASLETVLHDISFALNIKFTNKNKEVSLYK